MTSVPEIDEFVAHFDHLSEFFNENFDDVLARMRSTSPVAHSSAHGGFWAMSSYETVLQVDQDVDHFTTAGGAVLLPAAAEQATMWPVDLEPPQLRQCRSVFLPALHHSRLRPLEADLEAIADGLVDAFVHDGHCDVHRQYSLPLAIKNLMRIANIDDDIAADILSSAAKLFNSKDLTEVGGAYRTFRDLVAEIIRRRQDQPRKHDVVDAIVHGDIDGRPMVEEEKVNTLFPLLAGGFNTVAAVLSAGIAHLARHREVFEKLSVHPELIPTGVEEYLRLYASAMNARQVKADCVVGGQRLSAGERAIMLFPAANRDPDVFVDPDEFRLDRPHYRHLTFGAGPHRCPGSSVARLGIQIGLGTVLRRFDRIEVADPGITYETGQLRTPVSVPLRFVARGAGRDGDT